MNENKTNLPQSDQQPSSRTIVSLFTEEELKKLSLEERLNYMDKLLDKLEEPNIIEAYLTKKKEAKAIDEIKALAIKARGEIVEALGNSLRITVKQEEGMLGSRYAANLIATSEVLTRNMNKVNEQAIDMLVDDYETTITNTQGRKALDEKLKQTLLEQAKERLFERQADTIAGFRSLLAEYRKLIGELVGSIKKPVG